MNALFREALKEAYQANSDIYTDSHQYDAHMEKFAGSDMLSYSLARTCLLLSEEMNALRMACADNQAEKAAEICRNLERILREEHGIRPYHAAWAVNCWLYALDAHMCYFNDEYAKAIEAMSDDKLIPLANSGDAYASLALFNRDTSQKEWLDKAEKYDHPAALHARSIDLCGDYSNPENNNKALALCLQALEMGCKDVLPILAMLYGRAEGIEENKEKAFRYALMGAQAGMNECVYMLSDAYLNGEGVERNPQKAFSYMERLAQDGDAKAQYTCAQAYSDGNYDVAKDPEKAFYWAKKAADQGYGEALMMAAHALLEGDGVTANAAEARHYLEVSAYQGNLDAMIELGGMYLGGDGVARNEEEAAGWIKMAADAGSGFACWVLSSMYKAGIGVSENRARAEQYRLRAKELGYEAEDQEEDTSTYIDDQWDSSQIGHGDGINDIRDPDMRELFSVMLSTMADFIETADKQGLDLYDDQCRAYVYLMSKMANDCLKDSVENFANYLINFIYSSSCESYMSDSEKEYFNREYPDYVNLFNTILNDHSAIESVYIYINIVNEELGHMDENTAKMIAMEQVKCMTRFLKLLGDIPKRRKAK